MRPYARGAVDAGARRGHSAAPLLEVSTFSTWSVALFFLAPALAHDVHCDEADLSAGLLPDLVSVVPTHLQLHKAQQKDVVRFTNGIANLGDGPLQLVPEHDDAVTNGIQQVLDASGAVAAECVASEYAFHPDHNHCHLADVARYEIRAGSADGEVYGANSIKTTFCLIDWYELDDPNNGVNGATYWDCEAGTQGISVGWVDQYHHSLEDQDLDITGAPAGIYYLVTTANPDGAFAESDLDNNTAWTAFELSYPNNGNPTITVVGTSECDSPGLCGEEAANR